MASKLAGKDWVAIVIAAGICTAMNCFTFAVLYDAIFSNESGLSSNATQVLTGWGGGIIGLLGAYVGYRASPADDTDIEQQHSAGQHAERSEDAP